MKPLQDPGANVVAYYTNLLPVASASLMGTSSCLSCSTSDQALYLLLVKAAENGSSVWALAPSWETYRKLLAPKYVSPLSKSAFQAKNKYGGRRELYTISSLVTLLASFIPLISSFYHCPLCCSLIPPTYFYFRILANAAYWAWNSPFPDVYIAQAFTSIPSYLLRARPFLWCLSKISACFPLSVLPLYLNLLHRFFSNLLCEALSNSFTK